MKITKEKFKEILVVPGFITQEQFDESLAQAQEKNLPLEKILIEKDLISDEQLGKLISIELGYKFVSLRETPVLQEVINIVPELVARMQEIIVFDKTKEGLKVAMADPDNFEMADWLERKTGEVIIPYFATPNDIKDALKHYHKELKETFEDIIRSQAKAAEKGKTKAEDVSIIKIVDTLVKYAYENRASDVHIHPGEEGLQIRFRIDGILHNVLTLSKSLHDSIVTRIKVLSKLRTDEHFSAQDGKFEAELEGEKFDIRVSIVPVTEGENVVMRLLSERARRFSLETLGFSDEDLKKINNAIKKSYGMVLATGPTGCGKTTTLYAILKVLNRPQINICTIEDPVEYDIEGVSQIQVNPKTNLTFAQGLRSIVRQDPDIIMVGEIRDEETANIAINSAMTGHLVLSTMHANTAATNIIRLMDMGIEAFLVSSSVNVIIAQRLIRKICMKCRESYEISLADLKKLRLSPNLIAKFLKGKKKIRIYRGKGCKACVNTGYSGRIGIFEILEMGEDIKDLVMEKANADQIEEEAVKIGMTTMLEDGINKVLSGMTTIEEIMRVTRE